MSVRRTVDAVVHSACLGLLCFGAAAQISLVDVTAGCGLPGDCQDDSPLASGFGTGMCAADFDGDGDLDLVVVGRIAAGHRAHRYFRNDGSMQFTERTAYAGLGSNRSAKACRAADVDNDGDQDLFIGSWQDLPQLFINDGTGVFSEEAVARGLTHVSSAYGAAFGDFDRDGWIDLYIANRFDYGGGVVPIGTQANILYRNVGGGHFVDVTASTGSAHADGASFAGVFIDADEDGDLDLYMVNDKGADYAPGQFLWNTNGVFAANAGSMQVSDPIDAMGMDYVDVFNDGGFDYFVSDTGPDHLFRVFSPAAQAFIDETYAFGLDGGPSGWAVNFADFDNDGWFDLHVVHQFAPNSIFRNPAQPHRYRVPWPTVNYPIAPSDHQFTALVADFDDDGRVDILNRTVGGVAGLQGSGLVLHRNVSPLRNWIKVRTVGSTSNRDGIGTLVTVRTPSGSMRQCVRADVGYLSGSDRRVHFGLGDETVATVTLTWPSGIVQTIRDVAINRVVTVVEPSCQLVGQPSPGAACLIALESPNDAGRHYAVMLSMQTSPRTPLPDGRRLPIRWDALTTVSLTPGNAFLHGNVASLHRGAGGGLLTIPNLPGLSGVELFATAITFDATGVHTVFPEAVRIGIE